MFSGPEVDAHTRLAPKFTEYTKGKVKVQIEEGGRGDAYDAKWSWPACRPRRPPGTCCTTTGRASWPAGRPASSPRSSRS